MGKLEGKVAVITGASKGIGHEKEAPVHEPQGEWGELEGHTVPSSGRPVEQLSLATSPDGAVQGQDPIPGVLFLGTIRRQ